MQHACDMIRRERGPNPTCRGLDCKSTELIKAHIIPEGFGRDIRGDGPNFVISRHRTGQAKPQLGEYDAGILCAACDGKLGVFDDYALQVCRNFNANYRDVDEKVFNMPDVFEMPEIDGETLALFFLAVIWRASISTRPNFRVVEIGPYEDKARDVLFGAMPLTSLRAFQVTLRRCKQVGPVKPDGFYSLPVRVQIFAGRFNAYRFALGGFQVAAKLDARPFPRHVDPFLLGKGRPVRGLFVPLRETIEFQAAQKLA